MSLYFCYHKIGRALRFDAGSSHGLDLRDSIPRGSVVLIDAGRRLKVPQCNRSPSAGEEAKGMKAHLPTCIVPTAVLESSAIDSQELEAREYAYMQRSISWFCFVTLRLLLLSYIESCGVKNKGSTWVGPDLA